MSCLGNEQRSFCHFETASKYFILDSFVDYDGYSISSKRFLPTVVDTMVIWVKFTHSIPVHWFQKCRYSPLPSPIWPLSIYLGFSSGHVWMWELDFEESWAPKNWCFGAVVLEKTLESPLDCIEIQPVHPKGDPGFSLEGLMLKLKLQYFGHLMRRVDSFEKTLMLG